MYPYQIVTEARKKEEAAILSSLQESVENSMQYVWTTGMRKSRYNTELASTKALYLGSFRQPRSSA